MTRLQKFAVISAAVTSIAVVLCLIFGLIPAGSSVGSKPSPAGTPTVKPPTEVTVETTLTKDEILAGTGVLSGMFSQHAPYRDSELAAYEEIAGGKPNLIATFVKWDTDFRADAADLAYDRGALPLISWEPWVAGSALDDPAYSPDVIAAGTYDAYITRFATAVAAYQRPILIRFAHEMNGGWYPWGARVGSNTAAGYVNMWRHVHDIFTTAGAGNALWVWAPNLVRAIPNSKVPLAGLYPGDAYVDLAGMTAYSNTEGTADQLFEPTAQLIRQFTAKKILIAETGALPQAGKVTFINTLFDYVARPDIAGYVWFETDTDTGGNAYWRIEDSPESIAAYRAGIARTVLAPISKTFPATVPGGKKYTLTPLDLRVTAG